MTSTGDKFRSALSEVALALDAIAEEQIETICHEISRASKIGLYGCGREGLALRGFTMRLFHLGLAAAYLGEMNTPPLGEGDLLLVSAGPGELATVTAMMKIARQAGATVCLITAEPGSSSARHANNVLTIPAQTMASGSGDVSRVLPMGSAYEAALFFLFEIMVGEIRTMLGIDPQTMRRRHTNME